MSAGYQERLRKQVVNDMGGEAIKKEMQQFQASLKRLSSEIGKASSLWGDEKYSELSSSIGILANQSKAVLVAGERCCDSIEKFSNIAEEKY